MTFTPRFLTFLHGGDYNSDQWLDRPDILKRDVELMHKAHVNTVSIGIFSWARLEPEDGVYDFTWLDEVNDRLWKGGIPVGGAAHNLTDVLGVRATALDAIYADIAEKLNLSRAMHQSLPDGLIPTERGGAIFLQNYSGAAQKGVLEERYTDLLTGSSVAGETIMPVNGVMVLVK